MWLAHIAIEYFGQSSSYREVKIVIVASEPHLSFDLKCSKEF